MENTIKHQSIEVIRPSGVTGPVDFLFKLDPEYPKITGVRGYLVENGGQSYIEIAFKDRTHTIHHYTPDADWAPVVDYWYKPLSEENQNQDFFISTKLPIVNTSELKLIVVFRLEK
jgi:hypothetical protein